ncbi:hypothetical protein [Alkalihalobacillus pseudalcaliphilus]|nr:hypothetical protein [Alkalihalobacillus pseudalcaliphilus]
MKKIFIGGILFLSVLMGCSSEESIPLPGDYDFIGPLPTESNAK